MSSYLSIIGGRPLSGEVSVSGSKNASLPILISTLLTSEVCVIGNIPNIEDIAVTLRLLRSLGAEVQYANSRVRIQTSRLQSVQAPYSLVKALRASFLVLGPLLARAREAQVSLPGGDVIGNRPVDLHLRGLVKMGANIEMRHGVVIATAVGGLHPARIVFDYPSVGATEHLLMTAARLNGETVLENAAKEPEVVELGGFLARMGAEIDGLGTEKIKIIGNENLGSATISVNGDRIEAATYLLAGAATGGDVIVKGVQAEALSSVISLLNKAGCSVSSDGITVHLTSKLPLQAVSFETAPFPGIATDVQPLFLAAMTKAVGTSEITETVFDNRFGHVAEFRRFGAQVELQGRKAIVNGVSQLSGAPVEASDIRAGAGLVLMGLIADGTTTVCEAHHLDRGYENFIEKFSCLGANIRRVPLESEYDTAVGC